LLGFLEEAQLDRVGCFKYSPVEGAAANALAAPVPEQVKEERLERFMTLQARISADKLQRKIGTLQRVLVDEVDGQVAIGRTAADAPEIDGRVYIEQAASLQAGEFTTARITGAGEHDLQGRVAAD
jgi:ribosomal protein S12 methylthiotransferase